ncbi:Carbon disulfide hydrolase [Paramyrothecium foliicola]|nr:Carbon disulfide hydrolase [Paramyrothecium foliicola]
MAAKLVEFLDRNEKSLETYQPLPSLDQILATKRGPGSVCILSCADARVDPTQFFGLKPLEAIVIRNAGGRATDAFRSISVMGTIAPMALIIVVHHTDCGGLFTTDDEVRAKLVDRAPDHAFSIRDSKFGTFKSIGLEESIRHDVEEIRSWPFLATETRVVGYALDLETGALRQVE